MIRQPASEKKAVVIGGGFAGLATAALLAREGMQVTLLEARSELGGRAAEWGCQGFRFETGPSWYLMPDVFEHFFELFGTSAAHELDLQPLDPAYRVLFEGDSKPFDLPAQHSERALMSLGISADSLKDYLSSAAEAYDLATQRLLYSTYDHWRAFLDPALITRLPRLLRLLTQPLDRFIAGHTSDQRLQKILGYPAVFLGTSPSAAPSLYHLMSHLDISQGVLYPKGGFSAVVQAVTRMAQQQGVRIRTGATAEHIATSRGRATGVHFSESGARRQFLPADLVVSSADMHVTETQLLTPRDRTRSPRAWKRRDPGPSAVLALLGIQGSTPQLAHHTLLFTQDWQRGFDEIAGKRPPEGPPRSIYVCRPSATDEVAPPGHENLFVLVPLRADTSLGAGGIGGQGDEAVERVVDESIEQIAQWAQIPDLAERVVVRRSLGPQDFARDFGAWQGGALGPAHTLRQSAFLRGPIASPKVAGLFYAGATTMPGIGVPMCLISAELVLKSVRRETTTGPVEAVHAG
ncbi:phytoene desaturase family protein [Nesterenkonia sphaerica]|uniref:Phytoene desaturase n=1 Tax=Nesterenkonia sphaerica TaxID=1804988 RepID=A0A5R9A5W6_9MICC|nr:phytoene desaturase family protein [Nesterenkonia sphaerica]TLP74071.1 phytoene desaturase [Nesterenkonia sphaerica]